MNKKQNKTRNMILTVISLSILIILCLYFTSCNPTGKVVFDNNGNKEKPVVKIGVVVPLTGNVAKYGEWAKKGYDLAAEEIQSNNNYPYTLELIYEDDKNEPKESVSATQKLINIDKVNALTGYIMSNSALASTPTAEQNQIVLISPTASADAFRYAGDYIFRLRESSILHGARMADFSFYNLSARRIAVFYLDAENGRSYAESFKKSFTELGGSIVSYEGYIGGSTDFRTSLTKIREQKPDAVYIPGTIPEVGLILKQAAEFNLKIPFLSSAGAQNPEIFKIVDQEANGLIYTYPRFNPDCTQNPCKSFVEKYKAKYNATPEMVATNSYDIIMLLSTIFVEYGTSSEQIKEGLYKTQNYNGASGKISFDEYGDVIREIDIKQIVNSSFSLFQP